MKTLSETLESLETMHQRLNDHLFSGQLLPVVITIAPDANKGKKGTLYGHFTTNKVWKDQTSSDRYYEINVYSEFLARPIKEVIGTLLHEMVHEYCAQQGIKDTSRQGHWHNDLFKQQAMLHGLTVEKSDKNGWNVTSLKDDVDQYLQQFDDYKNYELQRDYDKAIIRNVTKSKSIKYVCPHCGAIVRATRELRILCGECGVEFKAEL